MNRAGDRFGLAVTVGGLVVSLCMFAAGVTGLIVEHRRARAQRRG